MDENKLENIVSLCKRRGFIFPGSDVYGGIAGFYDYGPLGVSLKRNIEASWWKFFVDDANNMFGIDASIIMNPKVWQASGHVDTFTDPMVECSNCHGRFRADKIDKSKCPTCGKSDTFSEEKKFNMMFKTNIGPVENNNSISYLRPETAQGIFTNYKNVVDSIYPDLPFGLAQIGKAFRNEISPRDFIFRVREFTQMEIEYFVNPEGWEEEFNNLKNRILDWLNQIGLEKERIHELEVSEEDRAHYSKRTIDFEYDFPIGKEELLGLAYRTDFDLKNIENASGKSMEYLIKGSDKKFIPHVIEPSFGLERIFMAILSESYKEDEVNGEKRVYLRLPVELAPVKICVSPLLKNKPELVDRAKEVFQMLKKEFGSVIWDDNGNIGKRYRRQDEIGTPYCAVVDFESLEDHSVTVRNRDDTTQHRIKIENLKEHFANKF
jgi:glycyl-tRNA synthetase